jgi:hypothetical protein
MSPLTMVAFLKQASTTVAGDVLLDDLREAMSVFPADLESTWLACSPLAQQGWDWERFRAQTAFKPPLAICAVTGVPLIPPLVLTRVPMIHRVILAAQHSSIRSLAAKTKKS